MPTKQKPSPKELERLFDITPDRIEEIDANACKGILEGKVPSTETRA